jgi:hypothetical protein
VREEESKPGAISKLLELEDMWPIHRPPFGPPRQSLPEAEQKPHDMIRHLQVHVLCRELPRMAAHQPEHSEDRSPGQTSMTNIALQISPLHSMWIRDNARISFIIHTNLPE